MSSANVGVRVFGGGFDSADDDRFGIGNDRRTSCDGCGYDLRIWKPAWFQIRKGECVRILFFLIRPILVAL